LHRDWCVPPEKPTLIHSEDPTRKTNGTLIATAYYIRLLQEMGRYARILHNSSDAKQFDTQAKLITNCFQGQFYRPEGEIYDNGSQTSSVLALSFGIVPGQDRSAIQNALVRRIVQQSDNHVGVGVIGVQWLMRTLSDNGLSDEAYKIATQKTYPGWGYMVEKGATTIWELWNGDTADPSMNSGNHVMQIGDLGVWMYEYLAGIRPDPERPGFKHIIIRPYLAGDLSFIKASHESMYGKIASGWERHDNQLRLDVTIPANTTATIFFPAKAQQGVTESGRPPATRRGVKLLRREREHAVYEVGSGTYSFTSSP
ncbi:MAG: alpha-rhamnosidase, partial [Acidobacteria bacterium]|nr:alpha-rhamnosidase [Acidobacteriota bacterium]